MAKKIELKERGTGEVMYPVTLTDAVLDLPDKLDSLQGNIDNLSEHIDTIMSEDALTNLLAYGVEWDVTVADPHLTRIGNMSMHKTLPIQSQLKGCIAQGDKIMYWLDENDWRFRKDPLELSVIAYGEHDDFTSLFVSSVEGLGIGQYLRYENAIAKIVGVSTSNRTLNVVWDNPDLGASFDNKSLEIGSRLDGHDGTVRVYCPGFYIKSKIIGNKRQVWLSTVKISKDWTYQPEILIDAYRSTVFNTDNGGFIERDSYLHILPKNSAVSVVNTNAYCRGGNSDSNYDKYLTSDIFRTQLGKPRTSLSRANMRTYSRNAGSEMLSYDQYKNIFYWLYVVEYANFNSQESYNADLTSDGYHQGGLGSGVTTWNSAHWISYTNYYPITPCGYGNTLGNKTGLIPLTIPTFTGTVGVINNMNNASVLSNTGTKSNGKVIITNITSTLASIVQCTYSGTSVKTTYRVTGLTEYGETIRFETGSGASAIKYGELSEDGTITVEWPDNTLNREFRFSETKPNVNIIIEVESAEEGTVMVPSVTFQVPRWRGFDNPFGDIWTNLDGIIIDADNHENNMNYVYTCQDPAKYADSLNDGYEKIGEEIHTDGYIKLFDLGDAAHIIPNAVGGNTTQFKCDYHWAGNKNTTLRTLLVGGGAHYGGSAGLGYFDSFSGVAYSLAAVGFRSVSVL